MERAICALCGKERRTDHLICPRCYHQYKKEGPRLLALGKPWQLVDWAEEGVEKKLAEFQPLENSFKEKEEEFRALQEEVRQEAKQILAERLAGQRVSREFYNEARREIERDLWKKKGGDNLFAEFKTLEGELEEKTSALNETLRMIEEIREKRETVEAVDRLFKSGLSESGQQE